MQLPVSVPAKGGPEICAWVTRPDGEKVMVTVATPLGSEDLRQVLACVVVIASAWFAASASKASKGGGAGSRGAAASSTFKEAGTTAGSLRRLGFEMTTCSSASTAAGTGGGASAVAGLGSACGASSGMG